MNDSIISHQRSCLGTDLMTGGGEVPGEGRLGEVPGDTEGALNTLHTENKN
jgi:hypothetical protein